MIAVCLLKPGANFTASGLLFSRVGLKSLQNAVDVRLSSLIPIAMIKHFDQKQFRGEKDLLGLYFEVIAYQWRS